MRYTLTPRNTLLCYQKGVGTLVITSAVVSDLDSGSTTSLRSYLEKEMVCSCCIDPFIQDISDALTSLRSSNLTTVVIPTRRNRDVSAGNPPVLN